MSKTGMSKTRGTGLLMVWTDIDAEFEAEFNRWYDEEHIARLLEVPGFLSAGRYRAVKGGPKYLAMYELEDHNVLRSAAYLDTVKYQPSPQRAKIGTSRIGRNFLRNAYRQIFPVHTNPIEQTVAMTPFLQMGRIDVSAAIEEEFNAWYNTAYIPGYLAVPGCLGARRFVGRGPTQIPDRVRVRACPGLGERGLDPRSWEQSVDAAGATAIAARRGLARGLPAHLPEIMPKMPPSQGGEA